MLAGWAIFSPDGQELISLFQDVARGHPIGGHDVCALSALVTKRRRPVTCAPWLPRLFRESEPRDSALLVEPVWADVCRRDPQKARRSEARLKRTVLSALWPRRPVPKLFGPESPEVIRLAVAKYVRFPPSPAY